MLPMGLNQTAKGKLKINMLNMLSIQSKCLLFIIFVPLLCAQEESLKLLETRPNQSEQFVQPVPQSALEATAELDKMNLTQDELTWLSSHPTVDFFLDAQSPPYQFELNGQSVGITVDILDLIQQRLGIIFRRNSLPTNELFERVLKGEIVALGLWPKQAITVDIPYLKSKTIIKGYLSLFGREDERARSSLSEFYGKKIGVMKGANQAMVDQLAKNNEILWLTKTERVGALLSRRVDFYLAYREVAKFNLRTNMVSGIKEIYTNQEPHDGAFFVHKDQPLLLSILDKAIGEIEKTELPAILDKWYFDRNISEELGLTAKEQNWLAAHPVIRVMSESDYPPFNFHLKGQPTGYSIEYVQMLARRLGIKLKFVPGNFKQLMDKAKNREVDLLHSLFQYPKQREMFLNFSQPYKNSVTVIVTRNQMSGINSLHDLAGKRVSVVKGDAAAALLKQQYPEILAVTVENYESALKSVAFGQADATISELPVVNYLTRKLLLNNLKVATELPPQANADYRYRLAVRKDWPEFIPILEKAMDSLSLQELTALDNRWLSSVVDPSNEAQASKEPVKATDSWIGLAAGGTILVLIIGVTLLLFLLLDRSKKNPLAFQFATADGKKLAVFLNALLIVIALILAWWALSNVKSKVQEDIRDSLQTVVQTTLEAMNIWAKDQINELSGFAADRRIVELTSAQLDYYHTGGELLKSPALRQLRSVFSEIQHQSNHIGFFIIASDGTNIGSMRDSNLGQINLIQMNRPDLMSRVFAGESLMIPPMISDVALQDAANIRGSDLPPTMFFASPIRNSNGEVIAALTERFEPHGDFSRINLLGRLGETGETYSFDKQGRLLSESRFFNDLTSIGLVQPHEQSILSIELRDPGGNLLQGHKASSESEKPLTRMALSATAGHTDFDINGYRDYRGVPVVGAWIWDATLGIGITSEIDVAEAMDAYYSARLTVAVILITMVSISSAFTLFTMVLGSRANRALQSARNQLEGRVSQRTSELEQALNELATHEKRLQIVVDNVPGAVFFKDNQGRHQLVNTMYEQVVGLTQKFVQGKTDKQIFSAELAEKIMKTDQAVMSSGKARQYEEQILQLDGTMRDFLTTKVPIVSAGQQATGLVGVALDITDRKQSEQKLKLALSDLNEQRFVLDQHAIVAVTDLRGSITYANQKFAEISGYSIEELVGQNHRILSSGHHNASFWHEMYRTISKGGVWNNEVCNRAKEGHLYWVETTIAAFTGDHGKPKAYVAIRTDISQRKRYEEELHQAKSIAEIASKTKSDFLASMSHEIRTPMNGVLGMLGLLFNSELSIEQRRKVVIAKNSAKSLLSLINDILDFSKVEAGKLELEELDFDLRNLLEEIVQTMVYRADEKDLELLLDVTGVNQSMVIGDPSRLRQILVNLVGNAIKFTEHGEVVINAKLEKQDEQYHRLKCSVRDTGIGIPENRIATLFDSFTQMDASTTRKYGGTGLGLAISKKLCELMQGQIQVTSQPAEGSYFTFEVLLKSSAQSVKVIPTIDISRLKILIVDDNATNREIFRHQLQHWGASIVEADSGQQALALCKQHADELFDIALVDMQMPEMDGEEFAKEIRLKSQYDSLKLLMMTSTPDNNVLEHLYQLGFCGVFTKPVSTSDLFDALAVAVAEGKQSHKAGALVTQNYLDAMARTHPETELTELPLWPAQTRILLVEDNQVNQLVAQSILHELALDCDFANNGLEAIASLKGAPQDAPYTAVLMDCQMPELDGYETTRRIRKAISGSRYRDIPIIALTANAMLGDKEKCLDAGMNDYLTKPIESITILRCLKKWLLNTTTASTSNSIDSENKSTTSAQLDQNLPSKKISDQQELASSSANKELALPSKLRTMDFVARRPSVAKFPKVLLKALSLYLRQTSEFSLKLNKHVSSNELESVRQLVHAIKGTSSNLGMYLVYERAMIFEDLLNENSEIGTPQIESLCDSVEQSMLDAQEILALNVCAKKVVQTREYGEVRRELIERLETNELIPEILIEEFKACTEELADAGFARVVIDALDAFDYEIALDTLVKRKD